MPNCPSHLSKDTLAPLSTAAQGLATLAAAKEQGLPVEVLVFGEELDLRFFFRHQGHDLVVLSDEEIGQLLSHPA